MTKRLLYILVLALSLANAPTIFANQCGSGKGLGMMVDSLRLDDSQKEKIKPILDQLKTSLQDSATQMKDINDKLHQQVQSGATDQSTVQGSRYLVKDFSPPWLKSTRQRAKLKGRDRPASGTLP